MIIEDSETIYQVNPEILNITDKDELLLAQQIRRRSLNWSGNTKVELQFNAWELFWQLISIIFFRFWACFSNFINEHASFNWLWLLTWLVN